MIMIIDDSIIDDDAVVLPLALPAMTIDNYTHDRHHLGSGSGSDSDTLITASHITTPTTTTIVMIMIIDDDVIYEDVVLLPLVVPAIIHPHRLLHPSSSSSR